MLPKLGHQGDLGVSYKGQLYLLRQRGEWVCGAGTLGGYRAVSRTLQYLLPAGAGGERVEGSLRIVLKKDSRIYSEKQTSTYVCD